MDSYKKEEKKYEFTVFPRNASISRSASIGS
jgi:hypothetical protein